MEMNQVEPSTHKEYTRLLTRIMDDIKKLNATGIGRLVMIGIEVPRGGEAPKLVAHGDCEMINAVSNSDIKEKMRITQIVSKTATLPLIDASALSDTTDEMEKLRGMVDILEVELRPRKKFFFKQEAPTFWEVGVPYMSVYTAEVRPHIGKIIANYLAFSDERRRAIEKGEGTDQ